RVQRCFNCGTPGHVVSECTRAVDRALVALARQYYNFFRAGSDSGPAQRIHEAGEWRQQRLRWLREFEPGEIRGELLREALGLRDGDAGENVEWLRNMACWGFPRGWTGTRDPREDVRRRIVDGPKEEDEPVEIWVFEDGHEEVWDISIAALPGNAAGNGATSDSEQEEEHNDPLRRWATYPNTHFHPTLLRVYDGQTLPALAEYTHPIAVSETYTADRHDLWQSILATSNPRLQMLPELSQAVPPLSPPPPPPPPPLPPPPLPPLPQDACSDSGDDMDLSD
ncbi:uncharacterized protein BXZ73DRAFT_48337, partial [Epithele typhae]|uniref:uncharacterized protein n=1 Tax=Epithele typhae TaxID=378194 RepID=UPI00200825A7